MSGPLVFFSRLAMIGLVAFCSGATLWAAEPTAGEREFVMDEGVWATFYDVPSRRFGRIREAFVARRFEEAARDLQTSIGFLSIEAERSAPELRPALAETISSFEAIKAGLQEPEVSVHDLDAAFARSHWLLAQHYLVLAMQSRDARADRNAGRYLWASAHHLERTVLWSDARISKKVLRALNTTRDLATRLQSTATPERVYRDRPIATMAKALIEVGDHLDRKVWVSRQLE